MRYTVFALTLCLYLCRPAPGQDVTGSLAGSVADPAGSAVAGASVQLVSESTAAVRNVASDSGGAFIFTAVSPGYYTVVVEHQGFKKLQKEHIELTPGGKLAVGELRLEIGAVSQSVTVQAEGATVQTATSERSGIVTSEEIQDLTVINRDFTTFAELQPGVVVNVSAEVQSFTGNNSINALGGRTTTNNILIDGIPSSNSNMGSMNTTISLDATQTVEVKVANFSAEYGRNSGVTIMAVSKGGTQQLHGGVYFYDRNEALNANNFFNNQKGLARQKYRISTAGGNIGGPLRIPGLGAKGKLFFLASMEEIREVRPKGEQDVTVPTALERLGDFSKSVNNSGKAITVKDPTTGAQFPGNVIPASRILKSTQNYLNLLPLPNAFDTGLTKYQYNYIFQESINVPKRIDTGRLDYNATEKTMMYLRFNYWWEDQAGAGVSGGNPAWGWLPSHYTATTPSAIYSITHILNPTTVLQGAMGFQRFTEAGPPLNEAELQAKTRTTTGVDVPQFNPSMNPLNLVPGASFGGVTNAANPGYATRFPLRGAENTFNWTGSVSRTAQGHTLKAGLYIERWRAMKGEEANFAGTLAFGSDSNNPGDTGYAYSNALIGTLANYTESNQRPPVYEYTTSAEWFAQDSWRVSRKLTLDLGVRFGWGQPWHSVQNLEASFLPGMWNPAQAVRLIGPTIDPATGKRMALDPYTGAILPLVDLGAISPGHGDPFNGTVYRITDPGYMQGMRSTDGIKTAPRLGFAWDPTGRGKTVIRAGGGLFYNVHERDNYQSKIQLTPPIQTTQTVEYTNVQTFIGSQSYQFPNSTNAIDPNRHIQMNMNYSFNVQQDVGFGTILDVAYVGNLGRHLLIRRDLNGTPLGTNWLPQNADATNGNKVLPTNFLRPYSGYSNVWLYTYGGNSNYHSLQTTVRRRYKGNLTYGVVWTWSKAMDYADDDGASTGMTVSSLVDPRTWNYGKAGYDHTHIFRFYYSYSLPRVTGARVIRGALNGWQVSGITTFQSGVPMGIGTSYVSTSNGGPTSGDVTGSTDSTWRVLMTGNPILPRADRGVNAAFNVNSFMAVPWQACEVPGAPSFCWGNAAKDVFRGPGINNWDASLFKNFRIAAERLRGQFRVEAYNVFNHTNFSAVNTSAQFDKNGVQTNQQLGNYTAAQFPRRLQLALRLSW